MLKSWRRGGDSNPRWRFWPPKRFSKPPHSAALPPLRGLVSTAYHTTLANLVHSWCTEFHGVQGRLHLLHGREYCRVKSFDVAILGHVRFCMTQDTLNDFLVRTQLIQVRRDATPEAMPAIPLPIQICLARVTSCSLSSTLAWAINFQSEEDELANTTVLFLQDDPRRRQEACLSTCRQLCSLFAQRLSARCEASWSGDVIGLVTLAMVPSHCVSGNDLLRKSATIRRVKAPSIHSLLYSARKPDKIIQREAPG